MSDFTHKKLSLAAVAATLTLLPATAFAHVGEAHAHSLMHPLSGLDHIAAMLAIGLWARQQGGHSAWQLPLAFTAVMAAGMLAASSLALPLLSGTTAVLLLVMGLLIASAMRLPSMAKLSLISAFALFQGMQHASEASIALLAGTFALQASGIWMAHTLIKHQHINALKTTGMGLAALATGLLIAG